ncbi:MAG: hypothetical protein KC800_05530 [Candidatus Eremiobacteraeota bacterium]|nr:hypothetical protein [Candidatus Eremiobacteraeota bacterium]
MDDPTTEPIKIGIEPENRRKIAAELSRLLADSYTLYLKCHNFHWNVTGPIEGANDEGTAGVGARIETHEKAAWMLRSVRNKGEDLCTK